MHLRRPTHVPQGEGSFNVKVELMGSMFPVHRKGFVRHFSSQC